MMDILALPPQKTQVEDTYSPKEKTLKTLAKASGSSGESSPSSFALALQDTTRGASDLEGQNEADIFAMGDLIDMINPLQHIPLVGTAYRSVTGDEIRPIARIVGGAVFGGPIGAAAGVVNSAVEMETGKDVAGNAMAMLGPEVSPSVSSSSAAAEIQAKPFVEILPDDHFERTDLAARKNDHIREPITELSLSTQQPFVVRLR